MGLDKRWGVYISVPIENSELNENMEFAHLPSSISVALSLLHLLTVTTFKSRTVLQVENLAR
jgi:hypothetical protein